MRKIIQKAIDKIQGDKAMVKDNDHRLQYQVHFISRPMLRFTT